MNTENTSPQNTTRPFGYWLRAADHLLARELEALSGNKLTEEKLRASIALYNDARSLTKEMYDHRTVDTSR